MVMLFIIKINNLMPFQQISYLNNESILIISFKRRDYLLLAGLRMLSDIFAKKIN